jgi:hypothetical protein
VADLVNNLCLENIPITTSKHAELIATNVKAATAWTQNTPKNPTTEWKFGNEYLLQAILIDQGMGNAPRKVINPLLHETQWTFLEIEKRHCSKKTPHSSSPTRG